MREKPSWTVVRLGALVRLRVAEHLAASLATALQSRWAFVEGCWHERKRQCVCTALVAHVYSQDDEDDELFQVREGAFSLAP